MLGFPGQSRLSRSKLASRDGARGRPAVGPASVPAWKIFRQRGYNCGCRRDQFRAQLHVKKINRVKVKKSSLSYRLKRTSWLTLRLVLELIQYQINERKGENCGSIAVHELLGINYLETYSSLHKDMAFNTAWIWETNNYPLCRGSNPSHPWKVTFFYPQEQINMYQVFRWAQGVHRQQFFLKNSEP